MKSRVEFIDHQPEDGMCPICDGSGRCRPCSGSGDFEKFRKVLAEDLAKAPVQVVTKDELREAAEDEDDEDDVGEIAGEIAPAEGVPWYMTTAKFVGLTAFTVTALWAAFRAGRAGAHVVEIVAWLFYVVVSSALVGAVPGITQLLRVTEVKDRALVEALLYAIVTVVGIVIVRRIYP